MAGRLPTLPGFNNTDIAVPSTDGNELYKFNSAGRHLQTINTLTATFDTPLSQSLTLGSHQYSVAVDSFANLPKPGSTANVFLSAGVNVTNGNGPPPPPPPPPTANTPEPSSLVLGGVALVGFAARRWTRKKGQPLSPIVS